MASVEKLKTCIRIVWIEDKQKSSETLYDTPPTEAGLKKAHDIAAMIQQQIDMGIFDRDLVFPNSPKRKDAYYGYYINLWKQSEGKTVAPSTWNTYLSKVDNHITPYWQKHQIHKVTPEKFEHWVYKILQTKLSSKSITDIVRLWRTIWTYWARHQKNPNDPTQYIKLSRKDPADIDPFNKQEISTIIEVENNKNLRNLWVVMLWSGLSTHELLPMAESDLDLKNGYAYIQRGFVKGVLRVTKNRRRKRQIELLPLVVAALSDQCKNIATNPINEVTILERDHITQNKQKLKWLWYNPKTKTHYTYPQLEHLWEQHLKKCQIRYRPLNTGRHTFASQVLSTGAVSAEWLANQLGHVDTDMIHRHYGKIIPKDSRHIINQLDQALKK